jgi:uncharacterized protein YfaQ (DUF2300 family)
VSPKCGDWLHLTEVTFARQNLSIGGAIYTDYHRTPVFIENNVIGKAAADTGWQQVP